jgi:hypothetical protein
MENEPVKKRMPLTPVKVQTRQETSRRMEKQKEADKEKEQVEEEERQKQKAKDNEEYERRIAEVQKKHMEASKELGDLIMKDPPRARDSEQLKDDKERDIYRLELEGWRIELEAYKMKQAEMKDRVMALEKAELKERAEYEKREQQEKEARLEREKREEKFKATRTKKVKSKTMIKYTPELAKELPFHFWYEWYFSVHVIPHCSGLEQVLYNLTDMWVDEKIIGTLTTLATADQLTDMDFITSTLEKNYPETFARYDLLKILQEMKQEVDDVAAFTNMLQRVYRRLHWKKSLEEIEDSEDWKYVWTNGVYARIIEEVGMELDITTASFSECMAVAQRVERGLKGSVGTYGNLIKLNSYNKEERLTQILTSKKDSIACKFGKECRSTKCKKTHPTGTNNQKNYDEFQKQKEGRSNNKKSTNGQQALAGPGTGDSEKSNEERRKKMVKKCTYFGCKDTSKVPEHPMWACKNITCRTCNGKHTSYACPKAKCGKCQSTGHSTVACGLDEKFFTKN